MEGNGNECEMSEWNMGGLGKKTDAAGVRTGEFFNAEETEEGRRGEGKFSGEDWGKTTTLPAGGGW